jgi:hypothetical protein
MQFPLKNSLHYFLYAFIGTFATLYVRKLGINPIVASSIVAIIISIYTITRNDELHKSWAAFCGTFAGMSDLSLVNWGTQEGTISFLTGVVVVSAIVAVLYAASEMFSARYKAMFFDGYGGRLGTIAFISFILYLIVPLFLHSRPFPLISWEKQELNIYILVPAMVASATIASYISMEIKNTVSSLNENYKVLTVAITGIIGGMLLTKIPVYGAHLGNAWYTGAFIGMSSYYILMLKRHFIIAGIISGILYSASITLFVGVGGKLGFLSFVSVLFMRLGFKVYERIASHSDTSSIVEAINAGESITDKQVNDDYAQKLVESLLASREEGTLDESVTFEATPIEEQTREEMLAEQLAYFEDIGYICFKQFGGQYAPLMQRNTASPGNVFSDGDKFIKLIKKQNRILLFSDKSYTQPLFTENFLKEDFNGTSLVTVLPLLHGRDLDSFFVLFDRSNFESAKNNLAMIRSML